MEGPRVETPRWTPAWVGVAVMLAYAVVVEAVRAQVVPIQGWALPVLGVLVVGLLVVLSFAQHHGWQMAGALAARVPGPLLAVGWMPWVAYAGWHPVTLGTWLIGGTGCVLLAAHTFPKPPEPRPQPGTAAVPTPTQVPATDRRPDAVRSREQRIRKVVPGGAGITVLDVKPWPKAADGEQVRLRMPPGFTPDRLASHCGALQGAWLTGPDGAPRGLPRGCAIQVFDGDYQDEVVLDIMLRDGLADAVSIPLPAKPQSINDPILLVQTPRGELPAVTFRQTSMIVGGAPGSGKTTFLHRTIANLAWCTDALIWVLDLNGGGLAEPWTHAWWRGAAPRPVPDWVAGTEDEALVMLTILNMIAKDRKMAPEAVRRRRAANTNVLPVDASLPAIILITDEGGEVRQSATVLGGLVDEGIARVAQIGRAEGTRVVMSVLRGTSALLEKNTRTMASLRVCLRMNEAEEYRHILEGDPGRTPLLHKGALWLERIGEDHRPLLARGADMLPSDIDAVAIAAAPHRPELDARAQDLARLATPMRALQGRDPEDYMHLPAIRDLAEGRGYSGRWDRMTRSLSAINDGAEPEPERERITVKEKPATPVDAFLTMMAPKQAQQPESETSSQDRAAYRTEILAVLADAPEGMRVGQIKDELDLRWVDVRRTASRQYVHEVLNILASSGEVVNVETYWRLTQPEAQAAAGPAARTATG